MPSGPTSPITSTAEPPPEEFEPKVLTFPIVGVGASAGGLEAFQQLLGTLSGETGMAFILIQHLDRVHKSLLTELLARVTDMVVAEVVEGSNVQANHVYVIPPNTEVRIADGRLHLTPRPALANPHLPIDVFLDSLATEQGRLALGIILSGTGADGVEGIKAIKARCGITFAQDEESAAYPAMPRSAIATGLVDYVLPPVAIAATLDRISHHPYVVSADGTNGADLIPTGAKEVNEIYSLLRRSRNVDFSHYRQTTLHRRLGRRMLVQQSKDIKHYLDYVRKHPEELDELYRDLLIHVTSFFRDPGTFAALREQVLRLVKNGQITDSFRVWVPGCSTGEEVYSIAIAAQEIFEDATIRPTIQIFGTDISEQALRAARSGFFGEAALRGVSGQQLLRHFRKVDGQYQINKTIRDTCVFAWQDVTSGIPFSRLHLISCRNMLIYVEPVLQKGVIGIFHYALNPAGLLFLGSAESTAAAPDLFATVDGKNKIFARKPGMARITQRFKPQRSASDTAIPLPASNPSGTDPQKEIERAIRRRYSPDCVVVNQSWQIVEFRGHTGTYLEHPSGSITADLMRMVKDDLRFALRDTLAKAIHQNIFVEKAGIRMDDGGRVSEVTLEVTPLAGGDAAEDRLYLIVFKAAAVVRRPPVSAPADGPPGAETETQSRVEADLADARVYIRAMSEDHASALEELRASNEELQSSNEELQSISEEQETTKEELQSTNEELNTVNDEMKDRNHQLSELGDDLVNLLGAANVPMFRVDRKMALCRYTPATEKAFGVGVTDLRQPIRFLQSRIGSAPDLEALVKGVMDSLLIQTREIQDSQGRWWSLAIRPYRTADDRLDGAVLTFADIHALHEALQVSRRAQSYAESIVHTVREPLVILTKDLRIESANAAFFKMFGLDAKKTAGQFFHEASEHLWNIEKLRALLQRLSQSAESFADFEMTFASLESGKRILTLNGRRLEFDAITRILLAFEDSTERIRAEQATHTMLQKSGHELDRTRSELRALAGRLMSAHEEEQRRIARELHDDLAQRLAFLEFQIEKSRLGPVARAHADVAELLMKLQAQIAELSDVTRNISHGLHPAFIEDLGLVAALRKLVAGYPAGPRGGARFVNRVGDCSLPKQHFSSTIYRIAQEALHNVAKHAVGSDITVTLTCKAKELLLTIRDNGPGFDPRAVRGSGGLGIVNMEERALSLGAVLEIRSARGKGTKISLRVQIPDMRRGKRRTK